MPAYDLESGGMLDSAGIFRLVQKGELTKPMPMVRFIIQQIEHMAKYIRIKGVGMGPNSFE